MGGWVGGWEEDLPRVLGVLLNHTTKSELSVVGKVIGLIQNHELHAVAVG